MNSQMDLFKAGAPFQRHSETSRASAEAVKPCAATLREKVFELIRYTGSYGLTDIEIQKGLGMEGSTQRPRRIELLRAGRIRQNGKRRTPSGREAAVWVAV